MNGLKKLGILLGAGALLLAGTFNGIFVYNEAGYQTHIRTIFGEEKVVTDVGYATKWFGRATAWKQALTLQVVSCQPGQECEEDSDGSGLIKNQRIVFLGNVDGQVEASTRFRLPQGDQFLKIAQEYRTPENFMATALAPAVKETLQATASLMTADDYFAGARSEFGSEFENQLRDGMYVIKRKEVEQAAVRGRNQAPALKSGGDLEGDVTDEVKKAVVVTEKVTNEKGVEIRKQQQFRLFGVEVVEARITNIDPNPQYKQRMQKVQQALADLAIARQDRLKEEEQKLLVTARGEKEVEQKRQETLRDQIEQTTKAETEKKLAIINAEREKQTANIAKLTSLELLEKAKVDAQATKTLADAEAYAKQAVIEADGALDKKLAAYVEVQKAFADAFSKAPVPSVNMGGANGGTGRGGEAQDFLSLLTVKAAKDLQLDMSVKR